MGGENYSVSAATEKQRKNHMLYMKQYRKHESKMSLEKGDFSLKCQNKYRQLIKANTKFQGHLR